ncbi:hypothetical protein AOQ71_33815 [Bradyrhizobium manausense]|uniref:Uncharacterized protein n=1 Tax=Bradyrhizobium manausense TaxID=989370 RepID=A0A0R3D5Q9_9BRAD|nr:hypothetical protein AOQ71_33815 [Bradyrhizobium manausense]
MAEAEVIGEYLHRRSLLVRATVGPVWRLEARAIYHIARPRPSICGSGVGIMQDMVEMADLEARKLTGLPRRRDGD